MIKNIIVGLVVIAVGFGLFKIFDKNSPPDLEQQVYSETLSLSTEYTSLRYQTENVLEKAQSFETYDNWKAKMDEVTKGWKDLEQKAADLEEMASKIAEDKVGFEIISPAIAYDKQEISNVFDKAPAGKKIATLAKYLGVDAKRAQLILNQTQDEVSREAYGEEGDVFEKCEQNSMRIKNGAKVTVFVGTVVLSGGVAGVVGSGAIATAGTVVAGADLALEITEDEARIALGDKNKMTEMAGSIRSVTEPAASILSIANIPGNLSKAVDKFSAVNFAADQVRSSIQDKKIIGISIQTNDKGEVKAEVAGLTEQDLPKWRAENNGNPSNETVEEIINNAKMAAEKVNETKQREEIDEVAEKLDDSTKNSVAGSGWKGTLVSVSGGNEQKQSTGFDFVLNKDGTVTGAFKKWKQEGNSIKIFGEDEADGYYEFIISGNSLTLSKMMIGGVEILPGQEYMGGIAPSGVLYKKTSSNEENKDEISKTLSNEFKQMPVKEFEELFDDKIAFENISNVKKIFGEPDVINTLEDGYGNYVYYRRLVYPNGNIGRFVIRFHKADVEGYSIGVDEYK